MKKILFIEDQGHKEDSIRQLLGLSNYLVLVAADGRDGIGLAVRERPDLILCDTHLPSVDGYGVILALQQYPETRGIPVILLTTIEEKDDFRKAMEAGADDFLARPFEGIELLRAVEACLDRHHKRVSADHGPAETHPGHVSAGGTNGPANDWHPEQQEVRLFKKRTMLYTEGQRASQVWYVVSGRVKTYLIHSDGKELITGIFGPGDCVGYIAAVHGGPYTDNAQVLEESALVVISRPEFLRLMSGDPGFVRQVIKWLSRSNRAQESGLLNLAYSSLRKKVANGILSLYDSFRKELDGKAFISVSRENLAAIIGSAPESLTRTLSDFRKERLVEVADGRIYVLDEHRLRNMIN
ncbi:MAG TPA: cyclic nucleotide-binding domain-containing protein [Puia sp.]|nr:cyclic nucleotide-binding domain-containing protein [Puia sp.]